MTNIHDLTVAIEQALVDLDAEDVLAILTGAFVGLSVEFARHHGRDSDKQITIDCDASRDITIHARKDGK